MELMSTVRTKRAQKRFRMANALEDIKKEKHLDDLILKEEARINETYREQSMYSGLVPTRNKNKKRMLAMRSKYKENLTEDLIVEMIGAVLQESLVVDEFIRYEDAEYYNSIVKNTLSEFTNLYGMDKHTIKTKSELLNAIYTVSEETAKKEVEKKTKDETLEEETEGDELAAKASEAKNKESKDTVQEKSGDLSDKDAKEEFTDTKENLLERITAEVKESVIDTIQQEREKAKQLEEERQEIKDAANTIETYGGGDELDEEISKMEDDEDEDEDLSEGLSTSNYAFEGMDIDRPSVSDEYDLPEEFDRGSKGVVGSATDRRDIILKETMSSLNRSTRTRTMSRYKNMTYNLTRHQMVLSESDMFYQANTEFSNVMYSGIVGYTLLESYRKLGLITSDKQISDMSSIIEKDLKRRM